MNAIKARILESDLSGTIGSHVERVRQGSCEGCGVLQGQNTATNSIEWGYSRLSKIDSLECTVLDKLCILFYISKAAADYL